jgi:SAM-dependent methyltransferase
VIETTLVYKDGLYLPPAFLARAGLKSGDVIEVELEADGVIVVRKAIDRTHQRLGGVERDPAGRPIPPTWMRQAVVGTDDVAEFLASGQRTAEKFTTILTNAGFDPSRFENVLDFGCGCGRLIRAMPHITQAQLFGCDIKQEFVDWCALNLAPARFVRSDEYPPLPFESNQFDLLYAMSILTHLDEEHQDRWLAEWHRIVKPGGVAIVTFRGGTGPEYAEEPTDEWRERVDANRGVLFVPNGYWSGIFPDFYQTSYTATDYVKEHWAKYFEIVAIFPVSSLGLGQDLALMRRR